MTKELQEQKGFRVIRIVSASEMDSEKARQIAQHFAERLRIQEYDLKLEIDAKLLGGFQVFVAGYRYDFSVKGHMDQLSEDLGQAHSLSSLEEFQKALQEQTQRLDSGEELKLWEVPPRPLEDDDRMGIHLLDGMRDEVGNLDPHSIIDEVGTVLSVSDGIAYVSGLDHCIHDELLIFSKGAYGMAMNLEEERIGVVLLGDQSSVREGSYCKRTGKRVQVPVGSALLGRVVDPLGQPLDGLGALQTNRFRAVEQEAPSVIDRQPVHQPLYTGVTAIDAMTPIGRGQRELIIGDRQTGKTALAIDAIVNQKNTGVACIYVAIGQKLSTVSRTVQALQKAGAMEYTTVLVASAADTAAMQYLAPYAGCAMAEEMMYNEGRDVLIVYDDLTKHAQAYRAISLLLRRPPGREAFPGDVFYLHSRLLERAARLSEELGGHSITALPIVETQAGDISAYIPTNVISITDGQIYLESELFFSGQRPAINVGLSVSRVGGDAQERAMKKVAGPLRLNLAQYRELQAFAQFGSELDPETQRILSQGARLMEILKQSQYSPRSLSEDVVLLYLASCGKFLDLDLLDVRPFCQSFLAFLHSLHAELLQRIDTSGVFSDVDRQEAESAWDSFIPQWHMELEDDAAIG